MIHNTVKPEEIPQGEYALIDKFLFIKRGEQLLPTATPGLIGALVRHHGNPSGTIEERQKIAARIAEEVEKRG